MGVELRDYQLAAVGNVRDRFAAGDRSVLLVSPTGSGKTVMFAYVTAGTAQKGKRVLLLAHRRELLRQISKALTLNGVSHAVMSGGSLGVPRSPVVVASVFTLANRLSRFEPPDLIVGDEAHHFTPRSTWGKVVQAFPKARIMGVTATPERLDGKGLGDLFQSMVLGPSVAELTMRGYLSPAEVYAPAMPDLTGVKRGANDYQREDLAAAMDKPSITGSAVAHYTKLAPGKKAVCFCVSIKHAEDVAKDFRAAGYRATSIDGAMDDSIRDRILRDFERGDIDVLTSCDLISEGFDLPAIEVAILLRPTESLSLYLQQVGRAIRPAPGKTKTIVLDHAGNTRRHGFIDEERSWQLTGRMKKAKGAPSEAATVRTCPKCYAAHRPMPACPACGHVYKVNSRSIEQRDGELIQVASADEIAAAAAESDIKRQFYQLLAIGKNRGFSDPQSWAFNVVCSKEASRLASRRDAFGQQLINGLTIRERQQVWERTVGTGEAPIPQHY